jgi:hypothetical protein
MASKHLGLLKAAGGQISLHSMHGRFLMKAAPLDVPHFGVTGLRSSLNSIGGEVSLHSSYGSFLLLLPKGGTAGVVPNSIGGEVSLESPLGAAVGAVQ